MGHSTRSFRGIPCRLGAALLVLAAAACTDDLGLDRYNPDARWRCSPDGGECGPGWHCVAGACIPDNYDAGGDGGGQPDTGPAPDGDAGGCPTVCAIGQTECRVPTAGADPQLRRCEAGAGGCPQWSGFEACDDGSPCTTDRCDLTANACVFDPVADSTPCDDDNGCSQDDRCQAGQCLGTTCACECCAPADCPDDGDLCNGLETCIDNVCGIAPDTAVNCDPSNDTACQVNRCAPETGNCAMENLPDGTECDSGVPCVINAHCVDGECRVTEENGCDDGNDCTADACDTVEGVCEHTPLDAIPCNDDDPCTEVGVCQMGTCLAGADTCGPRCSILETLTCGVATNPVALTDPSFGTSSLARYACGVPPILDGAEVAYRFVAPATGIVRFTVDSPDATGDLWLIVWAEGFAPCLPENVTCAFGKQTLDVPVTGGETYDVVIDGKAGLTAVVSLTATCGEPERCATPGDEDLDGLVGCDDPDCQGDPDCATELCAAEATLRCGATLVGELAFRANQLLRYACTGDDVWLGSEVAYEFTPADDTWVRANLTANRDLQLLVLEGHCGDNACMAVGSGTPVQSWQGPLRADTPYYFVVDSREGADGSFGLELVCGVLPTTESLCADGQDDDDDGQSDCADLDCLDAADCVEDCRNGFDDNDDGLSDCRDPRCLRSAACVAGGTCALSGVGINAATTSVTGTTTGGADDVDLYACSDRSEWGPEYVYTLYPNVNSLVTFELLTADDGPDLDLFVLDPELNSLGACDGATCIAAAATTGHRERLSLPVRGSKTYYVVVDGPNGAYGDFRLNVRWAERENCASAGDADGDGFFKCMDPDCQRDSAYCAETCGNGSDDDQDGFVDCADPACAGHCGRGCAPAASITCSTTVSGFTGDGRRALDWYSCLTVPHLGPEVAFRYFDALSTREVTLAVEGPDDLSVVVLEDASGLCDPATCRFAGRAGDDGGVRFVAQANTAYTVLLDSVTDVAVPYRLSVACSSPENCLNSVDDNNDGALDCLDSTCQTSEFCFEACANGEDDDIDGWTDCADPFCWNAPECAGQCFTRETLRCGDTMVADTQGGPELVSEWSCSPRVGGTFGPERGYRLTVPGPAVQRVTLQLDAPLADLVAVVLEEQIDPEDPERRFCSPVACVAETSTLTGGEVTFHGKPGATYHVIVDGLGDAEGRFTLAATCSDAEVCGNGVDDDGDGAIDCADRACQVLAECVETACADLRDNDNDGAIDCADDDCLAAPGCLCQGAEPITCGATRPYDLTYDVGRVDGYGCGPGIDLNGPEHVYSLQAPSNGRIRVDVEAAEFDAAVVVLNNVCNPQSCELAVDNAGPGEPESATFTATQGNVYYVVVEGARGYFGAPYELAVRCEAGEAGHCDDRLDNDLDTLTDCADADCQGAPLCAGDETGVFDGCRDRFDNDGDGQTDCLDGDCLGADDCLMETVCDDAFDDDGDGAVDCDDRDCAGNLGCRREPRTQCDDGLDNDGDGLRDCADPDCAEVPPCVAACYEDTVAGCGTVATEQSTAGQQNDVSFYGCAPERDESGGETVFRFTTDATRLVRAELTEATGLIDLFLLADACQENTCLAWGSPLTFQAEAGRTYYLVADGFFESQGTFNLRVLCQQPETGDLCGDGLDNDFDDLTDCADADCAGNAACPATCNVDGVITCGQVVVGGNAEYGNDISFYNCAGSDASGGEVVYRFTAEAAERVIVRREPDGGSPGQDLALFVLSDLCDSAACVAHGSGEVRFDAIPGTTYYVVVDGVAGDVSQYRLRVDCEDVR